MDSIVSFIEEILKSESNYYECLVKALKEMLPQIKKAVWYSNVSYDNGKEVWVELKEVEKQVRKFEKMGLSPFGTYNPKAWEKREKIERKLAEKYGLEEIELYEPKEMKLKIIMKRPTNMDPVQLSSMFRIIDLFGAIVSQSDIPNTVWKEECIGDEVIIEVKFHLNYGS